MTETTQPLTRPRPAPPAPRNGPPGAFPWATGATVVVADLLGPGPANTTWSGPIAGLWLMIVLPSALFYRRVSWSSPDPVVRCIYSLALTIVALLILGLGLNSVLPMAGVRHPLDTVPVTVAVNLAVIGLARWRSERRLNLQLLRAPTIGVRDETVIGSAILAVFLSVVGAIRINNGSGPAVTVAMLLLVASIFFALLVWNQRLNPGTISLAIYFVAAALLLMTSLRGWYITGHDIQREYRVFELTKSDGRWQMSRYKDAYNACLSITILPTMLARVTRLSDPYIYKAVFQTLFAVSPVAVFEISRRFVSTRLSVVAAMYFVAFPTYFTDMPFLDRQEIAFILVGASLLVISERNGRIQYRRVLLAIFSIGMVLSHYSTTYVFAALVAVTWMAWHVRAGYLYARRRHSFRSDGPGSRIVRPIAVIGGANLAIVLLSTFLWNTQITHTSHGLTMTLQKSFKGLTGNGPETKSSDVSYGLLSGAAPSAASRLASYEKETLSQSLADHHRRDYYPQPLLAGHPTPVVKPTDLPVTSAGRALSRTGIEPSTLNSLLRQGAARLMQLFVLAGLAAATISKRARRRVGPEALLIAWTSLAIVASQVVLPGISEDYGVLRAFQQALFALAPALVVGAEGAFRWAGSWKARRLGEITALVLFLSCVGVLPQLLGGYPPQLHLNNSGQYYDIYYVHPEEVAGIDWLRDHSTAGRAGDVQSEVQTDRYTFTRTQNFATLNVFNDIYPTLLRKNTFVFLGYNTTKTGLSTVSYEGDLITYRYPVDLLAGLKSRVYSNGGVEIFR